MREKKLPFDEVNFIHNWTVHKSLLRNPKFENRLGLFFGWLLVFCLIAIIYYFVYLVPYTKVEESFGTNAVHDVIYHGLDLDLYDHKVFHGVVARSCIGPLIIGQIVRFVLFILSHLFPVLVPYPFVNLIPKPTVLVISRWVLGFITALTYYRIAHCLIIAFPNLTTFGSINSHFTENKLLNIPQNDNESTPEKSEMSEKSDENNQEETRKDSLAWVSYIPLPEIISPFIPKWAIYLLVVLNPGFLFLAYLCTSFHIPFYSSRFLQNTFFLIFSNLALADFLLCVSWRRGYDSNCNLFSPKLLLMDPLNLLTIHRGMSADSNAEKSNQEFERFPPAFGDIKTLSSEVSKKDINYLANRCIGLLFFASVVFRIEGLLLALSCSIALFIARRNSIKLYFYTAIVASLLGIVFSISLDSYFWKGSPYSIRGLVWPELSVFLFNGVARRSSEFGTLPFYWYFFKAIPNCVGPCLMFIPFAFFETVNLLRIFQWILLFLQKKNKNFKFWKFLGFHTTQWSLKFDFSRTIKGSVPFFSRYYSKSPIGIPVELTLLAWLAPVVVLSFLPHKELRFIFPNCVALFAMAAIGTSKAFELSIFWWKWLREGRPSRDTILNDEAGLAARKLYRNRTFKGMVAIIGTVAAICGTLIASLILTCLRLQASSLNYPGGVALELFSKGIRTADGSSCNQLGSRNFDFLIPTNLPLSRVENYPLALPNFSFSLGGTESPLCFLLEDENSLPNIGSVTEINMNAIQDKLWDPFSTSRKLDLTCSVAIDNYALQTGVSRFLHPTTTCNTLKFDKLPSNVNEFPFVITENQKLEGFHMLVGVLGFERIEMRNFVEGIFKISPRVFIHQNNLL
eukprot:GHVP01052066.1.p1 GENE.GHVP01052066.1~~GHVP01052066.1.p1  ORF type:complete len:853 (+),score=91.33 GHVP01052066.1:458-3016(+)